MAERLDDDFELALGVAVLSSPGVYRTIAEGVERGETAEQIDRKLDRYRVTPKYSSGQK